MPIMKTNRIAAFGMFLLKFSFTANAQINLKSLKEKAENAIRNTVESAKMVVASGLSL